MTQTLFSPEAIASTWFLGPETRRSGTDVLLIDDDVDIAEMYRRRLTADGLQVVIAPDAATGIDELKGGVPGIVLLDIRLPGDDGFSVLEAIKSDPNLAGVPVLMLSNFGEPATVRRALDLGAREYLVKSSVTPSEVSLKVRAYLQRGTTLQ